MTKNNRKYVISGVLAAVTLCLDQWTKMLAREHLPQLGHRGRMVVDGFFNLRFSENTGVAFGMAQSLPGGRVLLTLVALAALALVGYYLRKSDENHVRMHVALGLVGGGAIGNLIDRIMYGRVTDFIVWYYRSHEWPAFNIADAALVVGVGLMVLDMIKGTDGVAAEKVR
jgi:signal peptidase II